MSANKNDNVLELGREDDIDGESTMAQSDNMAAEQCNMVIATTAMANEFGASAARRSNAADQLASDSQRMWSIAMTSPTVMAAHGMKVAAEMGSGQVRNLSPGGAG